MDKTARFWSWINGGFVKLSLHPGEVLSWSRYYRTEEGYHAEAYTFIHTDEGVLREEETDGRDCDGRHGESGVSIAKFENLKVVPATYGFNGYGRAEIPHLDEKGQPLLRAQWDEYKPVRVYDQYAQLAGY